MDALKEIPPVQVRFCEIRHKAWMSSHFPDYGGLRYVGSDTWTESPTY